VRNPHERMLPCGDPAMQRAVAHASLFRGHCKSKNVLSHHQDFSQLFDLWTQKAYLRHS
jgi:hypothetical protein